MTFIMQYSVVRIVYEDNKFKIKTIEKKHAFGLFVPLYTLILAKLFVKLLPENWKIIICCLNWVKYRFIKSKKNGECVF